MKKINDLLNYSVQHNILKKRDKVYALNQLLYLLEIEEGFELQDYIVTISINTILNELVAEYKNFPNKIEKELFKSKLMAAVMDKPSRIEQEFYQNYQISPQQATDYFYNLSSAVNYIKKSEIAKNVVYQSPSQYGMLDITINLSKPEKTPEEIKILKQHTSTNWPACFLCKEEEGFYGNFKNPDRANHRLITLKLNAREWFFQYSPYSYYREHSIVLSKDHEDMKLNKNTFSNLLAFIDQFPHYMIGSNADLPIVGGSMLTHDHYQAGCYEFPLFKVQTLYETTMNKIQVQILNWALSTIRLIGPNKEALIEKANDIFQSWLVYENKTLEIISKTTDQHNTITPIVRKQNANYEIYLILRNNRTTKTYPDGIFHPHQDKHHIKKENIGLIEAMGLAVLPGRLLTEMTLLQEIIMTKQPLPKALQKHESYYQKYQNYSQNNLEEVLKLEIGKTFELVLEDCSVFKENLQAFKNFLINI
ncbi:MAG: galactose-1-phosphate uridylyltransferase [Mycoplasmatales bacterium]